MAATIIIMTLGIATTVTGISEVAIHRLRGVITAGMVKAQTEAGLLIETEEITAGIAITTMSDLDLGLLTLTEDMIDQGHHIDITRLPGISTTGQDHLTELLILIILTSLMQSSSRKLECAPHHCHLGL